ncbi:MAG: N(4)-(beta-N-acetylglucosaminyl)-L-asparaginase [Acidobacteriaceae bacterium]
MSTSRRVFLSQTAMMAAGVAGSAAAQTPDPTPHRDQPVTYQPPKKPIIITRETGDNSIAEAYAMLLQGTDTLDAALHICQAREDDPHDHSVGLGGLPNEDGVVELDACVMHGPTRRAGSVAALPNIRYAAKVAETVMRRTGHVMIVGEGAERFAVTEGFHREDMLTDDARKIWLLWKEHGIGWWGPGLDSPDWRPPVILQPGEIPTVPRASLIPRHPTTDQLPAVEARIRHLSEMADRMGIPVTLRPEAVLQVMWPTTGTIHVSALNTKGEISGATTTSGLAWKIPGRVGDSPIIGAGCYTDQDIGSAGATGNGEENIKIAGAHTIVDLMRRGATPKEAGLEALRRIARNYNNDMTKLRYLDMIYYIVRRDGQYAGVSLWSTRGTGTQKKFVVHDGTQRTEPCDYLFEGTTKSIHPF